VYSDSKLGPLQASPIGTLVPISGHDARFGEDYDANAFVPDDLPRRLELSGAVWMVVSEAMTELGRLDAAASLIPNPHLIARLATRQEAVGTSALEGTFADLTELLAAEVLPPVGRDDVPPNVREVMNYARAADSAYEWIKDRPITLNLLGQLQAEIVSGTPSDGPEAGGLRTSQVFIGTKNRRVSEARFIPPPPGDHLRVLLDRWIDWLTAPTPLTSIHLIARIAMAHYQFETIHPFTDGNGRVGRLVAVLQILREGVLRAPVLAISPRLEEHADEYRDHLLAVSITGDWEPWITFLGRAIRDEARAGHDRIMRLLDLRRELGDTVRQHLPRARLALEIADDLIAYPMLSVADAHRRYGRSNQANRDAINALVQIGVLEPYGSSRYDRLFWNRRVFQVVGS
jgi:Fic family protein